MDIISGIVQNYIAHYTYGAIFFILILCGIGLPVPEEITLIGTGYIAFKGLISPAVGCIVCICGILIGDSLTYFAGKLIGPRIFNIFPLNRIIKKDRFNKISENFEEKGWRAVFYARFFMGFRMVIYFVTGSMKKSYLKFLLFDLTGSLITVPISIYFGYIAGDYIEIGFHYITKAKHYILIIGFSILIITALIIKARKKNKSEDNSVMS